MKFFIVILILFMLSYTNTKANQTSHKNKTEVIKKIQRKGNFKNFKNFKNSKSNGTNQKKILGPPANTEFLGC